MEAYVTLVATDSYAAGALNLCHRLRDLGSNKETVCLVTPNISNRVLELLSQVCTVIPVDTIRSRDFDNLDLLGRPELDITFTKIQLWRLTQYSKIVYLDADTYPLTNIDELFDKPSFSAAPDAGWPDCFNSGVFVTEPSETIFNELLELSKEKGSFDGGDQGLLNTYFSSWSSSPDHRLPFTFNTTPTSQYGYAPAHNQYGHTISVLHFIGQNKPWKYQRFTDGKVLPLGGSAWEGLREMVQEWWNTWDKHYGRVPPYHLLSGEFDYQTEFDSGFQTRPIVPFDEEIKNAWDDQPINLDDQRRIVNPMPPVSNITISHPQWIKDEPFVRDEEKHEPYYGTQPEHHHPQHHVEHQHHEEPYHEESRPEASRHDKSHPEVSHHEVSHRENSEYNEENDTQSHHGEHHEEDRHHQEHPQHKEIKTYSMIEWDPAYQDPPKTGSLGADIPDLSSFKNVWDQSHIEQQNYIWVAPVHQPEPQIMTKPEYSNYNTDDYDSEYLYPREKNCEVEHHHEEQHHDGEPYQHEEYHKQESQYKEEDKKEEQHHHEQDHHEEQHNHYRPGIVYPPSFPWDSIPNHFPVPTRVWQSPQQQQQWPEEKRYSDDQKSRRNEEHRHEDNRNNNSYYEEQYHTEEHHHEEHHHEECHHEENPHEECHREKEYHHEEQNHDEGEHHDEGQNHDGEQHHNEEQHRYEEDHHDNAYTVLDDKDQPSESQIEKVNELEIVETVDQAPVFAIDEVLSTSAQSKIDEFIAALAAEDRDGNDFSDRDLIPIKFKSSSRLQTGMYTPSPVISTNASQSASRSNSRRNSRSNSQSNSRNNSRRASVSSSRRGSVAAKKPSLIGSIDTYTVPREIEQSSKLFADETVIYSRKTPYTSAAATPAASEYFEGFERDDYFVDEPMEDKEEAYTSDFLEPTQYSLSESLEIEREAEELEDDWNPNMALNKLKEHSESMVLRQSLHEALIKTAKQQEKEGEYYELATEPVITQARTSFKSSWDDEEYDLPSAMISGQSTPRTPVARSMSSNLSREIEMEKERHKQQYASLKLAKPQTAEASVLEAELDLSQGTLFKRRYYEDSENGTESIISTNESVVEEPAQEPYIAYYDYEVMKEAQRKLKSLITGEKETETLNNSPLPITKKEKNECRQLQDSSKTLQKSSEEVQPFGLTFNRKTYLPNNFGFDQNHKLYIYQAGSLLPETLNKITHSNKNVDIKEDPNSKNLRIADESISSIPTKTSVISDTNASPILTSSITPLATSKGTLASQIVDTCSTKDAPIVIEATDATVKENISFVTEKISVKDDTLFSTVVSDTIHTVDSKNFEISNVGPSLDLTKEYTSIADKTLSSAAKSDSNNTSEKCVSTEEPISTNKVLSVAEITEKSSAKSEISKTGEKTVTETIAIFNSEETIANVCFLKNDTKVREKVLPIAVSDAITIKAENPQAIISLSQENSFLDAKEKSSHDIIEESIGGFSLKESTSNQTASTLTISGDFHFSEEVASKITDLNVETASVSNSNPVISRELAETPINDTENTPQASSRKMSSSEEQNTPVPVVKSSHIEHFSVKSSHKTPEKLIPAAGPKSEIKALASHDCSSTVVKPLSEKQFTSTEGHTILFEKSSKAHTIKSRTASSLKKSTKDNQGIPVTKAVGTEKPDTPSKDVSYAKIATQSKHTSPLKAVSRSKDILKDKKASTSKPVTSIKTKFYTTGAAPPKSVSPTKADSSQQEIAPRQQTVQDKAPVSAKGTVHTKEILPAKPVSPSKAGVHNQRRFSQTKDIAHIKTSDGSKKELHTGESSLKLASPTKTDINAKTGSPIKPKSAAATKIAPHTRENSTSQPLPPSKINVQTTKEISSTESTHQTRQVSSTKANIHAKKVTPENTTVNTRKASFPKSASHTNIGIHFSEDSHVKTAGHSEESSATETTFASKAASANKVLSPNANSKDENHKKAATKSKVHTNTLPPILVRSKSKSTPVLSTASKALPSKPAASITSPPKSSNHSGKNRKKTLSDKKYITLETAKTATSGESEVSTDHYHESRTTSFTIKRSSPVITHKKSYASVTKSHTSLGEHQHTELGGHRHHSSGETRSNQIESLPKTSSNRPTRSFVPSKSSSSIAVVSETNETFTAMTRSSSKIFTEKLNAPSTESNKQVAKPSSKKGTKKN